jgi:hypothetical protein
MLTVSDPSNAWLQLEHSSNKRLRLRLDRLRRPWPHLYLSIVLDHLLQMSPKGGFW